MLAATSLGGSESPSEATRAGGSAAPTEPRRGLWGAGAAQVCSAWQLRRLKIGTDLQTLLLTLCSQNSIT